MKNKSIHINSEKQNSISKLKISAVTLLIVVITFCMFSCTFRQESWKWLHGLSEEKAAALVADIPNQIEQGLFKPDLESLRSYVCPEWFQDAKFGIWMCYGLPSVPARDNWYGRGMYLSKEDDGRGLLEYHKENYGHPSEFGFKDFIPQLTAENFDPDYLVELFKQAGAKYFIALAVQHENFDNWDSEYHRWNVVNMGPEKDIIGMFRDATLKHGLRWGVSTHLARSFTWLQPAHGKDDQGEYDGNNPEYWDFYHKPYDKRHKYSPYDPLSGNPWLWRARFPDWHTETDSILVSEGFYIAYINTNNMYGSPDAVDIWNRFYEYLTKAFRLNKKVSLSGASRGGLFVYNWAKQNPKKVNCIYAESPVCDFKSWPAGFGSGKGSPENWTRLKKVYGFESDDEAMAYLNNPVDSLELLAVEKIPVLHMIGLEDKIVPAEENTFVLILRYVRLGGIATIVPCTIGKQTSEGHHFPIDKPEMVVDFIKNHTQLTPLDPPSLSPN